MQPKLWLNQLMQGLLRLDQPVLVGRTELFMTNDASGQTIPNNTATMVNFEYAQRDDMEQSWSLSEPSKLYVPRGVTKMRIAFHVEWAIDAGAAGYRNARIFVNGAAVAAPKYSISDTRPAHATISVHQGGQSLLMDCEYGDYIQLRVIQTSGGDLDVLPTLATYLVAEWYK